MSQLLRTSPKAIPRGRAYSCLRCPGFMGEKGSMISHAYKYHLPLDLAPFFLPAVFVSLLHREGLDPSRDGVQTSEKGLRILARLTSQTLSARARAHISCRRGRIIVSVPGWNHRRSELTGGRLPQSQSTISSLWLR